MRFILATAVLFGCMTPLCAQTPLYLPLSKWQSHLTSWESTLAVSEASSARVSGQPVLPGLRPQSVELLQDALLRKHPRLLRNDQQLARQLILRRYTGKGGSWQSRNNGRNQLRGAIAEAMFLERNPDWKYVLKPNAPQHDVYRHVLGRRPPLNGQVKFHVSGDPGIYAQDMLADFQAHRFFVPDDHLPPVRALWLQKYEAAKLRGDQAAMKIAARNAGRVQPMGVKSSEIAASTRRAVEYAAGERMALYVTMGSAVAISLGSIGWDYSHGAISQDQAVYRATKAMALIGTGVGANVALSMFRGGALSGTVKGSLLVGAVVLIAETSWNIQELGGFNAFRQPEFFEQLGGSMSATVIGGIAGLEAGVAATLASSELGPLAPVVGTATGIAVGAGVGVVAYIGGRSTAGFLIRSFAPSLYQQYEQQQIGVAKAEIRKRISALQVME